MRMPLGCHEDAMRSQSLQVWRTKCLYLTQFGVSSRIFPTSTSPAAQHGPSGRARARGAITTGTSTLGWTLSQVPGGEGEGPVKAIRRPAHRARLNR